MKKSVSPINDISCHGTSPHITCIERFHSRGQLTCKFIGTKGSVYIRKELNSHRTGLVHQHGRRFIVLEHQYGCRDVMCKRSIRFFLRLRKLSKSDSAKFNRKTI